MDNAGLKKIQPAVLRKVVNYLSEELRLKVYGPNADLDKAQGYHALMDYDAEDCVKLRALYMKGIELKEPEDLY